jgi:hypothetical protein
MLYWILLLLYLVLLGTATSSAFAALAAPHDRPAVYWDRSFLILISLLIIPALILFVILMSMNWAIALVATIIGVLLGSVLQRIAVLILILPLYKLTHRGRGPLD